MSAQFEPPPDAVGPPAGEPGHESYGPPPLATTALIGFIASLVVCFPVFQIVGLILGIVGIVVTAGGKRRGRGLAIAAIPISLLVMAGQGLLIYFVVYFIHEMKQFPPPVEAAFRASSTRIPEAAADAYEWSSARFRQEVSPEQFAEWVAGIVQKHGQLQEAEFVQPSWMEKPPVGETLILHRTGRFVNGTAAIDIEIAREGKGIDFRFDDIRVDGESPLDEP